MTFSPEALSLITQQKRGVRDFISRCNWQTPDVNKSSKVQQKKSGCHYTWGVVRCLLFVRRCLQQAVTASSYYKSFPCNNLLTSDQTRKGQRDKGTKGTKGTTKIIHPLGIKKNQATYWDKKNIHSLWTTKNPATSWDKKTCNLSGQKKIRQPLRTKKKLCNLPGQKKNQATPLKFFRTFWVCHSLPWSSLLTKAPHRFLTKKVNSFFLSFIF